MGTVCHENYLTFEVEGLASQGLRSSKLGVRMFVCITAILLSAGVRQIDAAFVFPAAVEAVADRPNVFRSRTYNLKPLPTFAEAKPHLPEPIVAIHPEWVQLYWEATWELAFKHLKQPELRKRLREQLPSIRHSTRTRSNGTHASCSSSPTTPNRPSTR